MDEPTLERKVVVERKDFPRLFDVLKRQGYQVFGPTVREGAIVYDELASMSDLPIGWTDEQGAGTYRLRSREDQALFGYAVGPHSWKKFLHPPAARLWQASRTANGFQIVAAKEEPPKFAFIGVRSCELHAIAIQDKVLIGGPFSEPVYQARREQVFVVAVNCGQAGGTCFCVSMNTGPKATSGFDLALTEILEDGRHYFTVEAGTDTGREILRELPHVPASDDERRKGEKIVAQAAAQMGRSLHTDGIKELLYANLDNPRWDEVAARCLSCGNCTMVCPTCYCSAVEDTSDLQGEHAERWRKWESCFSVGFSYLHGGAVRPSARSRYRQWLTHKLASWIDQFGSSGCVGCGRCITWCPVGIDITEEVAAIRAGANKEPKP